MLVAHLELSKVDLPLLHGKVDQPSYASIPATAGGILYVVDTSLHWKLLLLYHPIQLVSAGGLFALLVHGAILINVHLLLHLLVVNMRERPPSPLPFNRVVFVHLVPIQRTEILVTFFAKITKKLFQNSLSIGNLLHQHLKPRTFESKILI